MCREMKKKSEGKNMVVDLRHDFLGVEAIGKDGKPVRLILCDSQSEMEEAMMREIMEQVLGHSPDREDD